MKKMLIILAVMTLLTIVVFGVFKGVTALPYPMNALPIIVAIEIVALSSIFYGLVARSKHTKKGG